VLARQLAPEGAGAAVAEALAAETDPAAAHDLLLAAARWPSQDVIDPVLRWMEAGDPVAEAATEAAWWLQRAGELQGAAASRALGTVRLREDAAMTPAAVALLAALGSSEDVARVAGLLGSSSGAVRMAAAEALVWFPEFAPQIITAAAEDPELFELASRAILVNNPSEEGLRTLLALPQPSSDIAIRSILRTANGVNARDLLNVVRDVHDPTLQRSLLGALVAPPRLMSGKADPTMLTSIAEGTLQLADLELSEHQPEAALGVLDGAPFAEPLVDAERLGSLRCAALVGTGQVEAARGLRVPAAAWLRGLELARNLPAAGAILQEIETQFGSTLTDDQKAQLDAVKKALASESTPRAESARAPG
jgi:hypothetical protein